MCNLYSMTKARDAIRQLFGIKHNRAGNLPPLPGIFPDYMAPIVRKGQDGERELVMARWGMPTPPQFLKGRVDRGVTNIRNVASAHWRAWMKPEFRCLVPATSFCEPTNLPNPATGRKQWTWFALADDRPLFAFAGIWCSWTGTRGKLDELLPWRWRPAPTGPAGSWLISRFAAQAAGAAGAKRSG